MLINRLKKFLQAVDKQDYALIGSGSCAENILGNIAKHNLKGPIFWGDNSNIGKNSYGYILEDLKKKVNCKIFIMATFEFKEQIKTKIHQYFEDAIIFSIGDFDDTNNQKQSEYPIIINTIPKCGNMFIHNNFVKNFTSKIVKISAGPWPDMKISESALKEAVLNNSIVVDHFPCSKYNLSVLKDHGIYKIVLHARDIRQATLSWLHWLEERKQKNALSTWEIPNEKNYFDLPLNKKIDYQIANWLPTLSSYIDEWLTCKKTDKIDILFTDFEIMKTDPNRYFAEILAHFQADISFDEIELPSKNKMHFRKGLSNEWLDVFNREQIIQSRKFISSDMEKAYGWR